MISDFAIFYLKVLLLENERRCELASILGEVDLNEPVSLLPGRLPKGPAGLPYNNEPLLGTNKACIQYGDIWDMELRPLTKYKISFIKLN